MTRRILLPHPGEVLREKFLEPMGLSGYSVATAIGAPRSRLNAICHGAQGVTAAIDMRLGKNFDVESLVFVNMQTRYDLQVQAERLADKIVGMESRHLE